MSGCYICRPEDPNAAEDGCEDCEREWEEYFAVAYRREIEVWNRKVEEMTSRDL